MSTQLRILTLALALHAGVAVTSCGKPSGVASPPAPPAASPAASRGPLTAPGGAIFSQVLLNAASALNAAVGTNILARATEVAVYIEWGAGTSAGAVAVESASEAAYTGTWANLATVSWSAASKQDVWRGTGSFGAIRTRISTAVTGGTVTTRLYAQ